MGINNLLKKSRTTHPFIGWFYLLLALIVHACTYLTSSAYAEEGGVTNPEAATTDKSQPSKSESLPTTSAATSKSSGMSDKRYQALLNEFLSLKDRLAKAGVSGEDINALNAKLAEVQSQLEVLDQEKKASSEISNFLKDKLQKTEDELKDVVSTKEARIRMLLDENEHLKGLANQLKQEVGKVDRDRTASAEVPSQLKQRLQEVESQLKKTQMPENEQMSSMVEENHQLKDKLEKTKKDYQDQITALEQEKQAALEAANNLRDQLQTRRNSDQPSTSNVDSRTTFNEEGLQKMVNDNILLKAQVSDLQQELREKVDQYNKEKKTYDEETQFFKERLAKAEEQLKEYQQQPGDARYQILLSKNNTLKEELNRVRTEFSQQIDVLETEKNVIADASRVLSDRLDRTKEELEVAKNERSAPSPIPIENYSPTPSENASQWQPARSIPGKEDQSLPPSPETPDSFPTHEPVEQPEVVRHDPSRVIPSAPSYPSNPPGSEQTPVQSSQFEISSDGTVEDRLRRIEEHLQNMGKRSDERIQAVLNQNSALRAGLNRVRKSGGGVDESVLGLGEDASLSDRVSKLEENFQNFNQGKSVEAEAVNSIHERLKKAEDELAGMEATKSDFENIQAQLAELNRVKKMSADVVGVLYRRLKEAEDRIANNSSMSEKERQMSAEVARILHERLSKAENEIAAQEQVKRLAAEAAGVMNERLKRAEEEIKIATANSESTQNENSSLKDEIADLRERFDSLGGGGRSGRGMQPPSSGYPRETPIGPGLDRNPMISNLARENETLRNQLLNALPPENGNVPNGQNQMVQNQIPGADQGVKGLGSDRYQDLLNQNAELKRQIEDAENLKRKLTGSDQESPLRDSLSSLRLTQANPEEVERRTPYSNVPMLPMNPMSPADVSHNLIRENNSIRGNLDRAQALDQVSGGDRGVYGGGTYGGSDDRLFQLLMEEHDNLKRRLNDMQGSLAQIARLSAQGAGVGVSPTPQSVQVAGRPALEAAYSGTITLLKTKGNFAIVKFPEGNVPPVRTKLDVYREGLLVGSIQVTNPIKPPLASADILDGTLRIGDEVR